MDLKSAKVKAFFDGTNGWLKRDYQTRVRSLVVTELLADVSGCTVLDLGCGDGSVSLPLLPSASHVTMVDLSDHMLERARKNTPGEYRSRVAHVRANLHDLEAKLQYDVVLCIGVLAHVDSVEATIAKVSSLVKLGGRCILQITDSEQALGKILFWYSALRGSLGTSAGYSLNKTTLSQVCSIAARNGLRLVSMRRHELLLPGMRRFPKKWLLKYDLFVLKNSLLSRNATSALLLFEKGA